VINVYNANPAGTDSFIQANGLELVVDDYPPHIAYDLFGGDNGGTATLFVIINGVTNSPSHRQWEVLYKSFSWSNATPLRNVIDRVKAPPPLLSEPRFAEGAFEFKMPAQRGQTNRVEVSTNLLHWTTLTNVIGTNASVLIRDANTAMSGQCFYRVVRP
jgi:hypothetical protein